MDNGGLFPLGRTKESPQANERETWVLKIGNCQYAENSSAAGRMRQGTNSVCHSPSMSQG